MLASHSFVYGLAGPQHISEVGRLGYGNQWRLPLQGESGAELARVLGGGVVPGSLTLVGGDPGQPSPLAGDHGITIGSSVAHPGVHVYPARCTACSKACGGEGWLEKILLKDNRQLFSMQMLKTSWQILLPRMLH